jgi:hypothetical protein
VLGSRVVPRRKQLGRHPDEAMSSSRGDARAAKQARTGGAKTAPRQDQRVLEQDQCVLRQIFRDSFLDAEIAKLLFGITKSAYLINKRTGSAREPHKPACCPSHQREVIGGAPEWCAFGFWVTRRLAVWSTVLQRGVLRRRSW